MSQLRDDLEIAAHPDLVRANPPLRTYVTYLENALQWQRAIMPAVAVVAFTLGVVLGYFES